MPLHLVCFRFDFVRQWCLLEHLENKTWSMIECLMTPTNTLQAGPLKNHEQLNVFHVQNLYACGHFSQLLAFFIFIHVGIRRLWAFDMFVHVGTHHFDIFSVAELCTQHFIIQQTLNLFGMMCTQNQRISS